MNWGHFAAFADLWVFRRSWRMRLLLVVGLCVTLTPVYAQEPAPYTLHVNIRLMQIPTLVLSPTLRPLPPVDAKRFRIQVDSGPSFRPTAVRREGDDPISLAVLLDLSGNEDDLISAFDRDLSPWIAASLRPTDRIAIYGLDCILVRTKGYMEADPDLVQRGFKNILRAPGVHGTRLDSSCGNSMHLWDALEVVARQVAAQPGRGVILAVTTGDDHGSVVKLSDLERFAAGQSVGVFGLSERVSLFNGPGMEKDLSPLCEYSGGPALCKLRPGARAESERVRQCGSGPLHPRVSRAGEHDGRRAQHPCHYRPYACLCPPRRRDGGARRCGECAGHYGAAWGHIRDAGDWERSRARSVGWD
jgi:hypothetical protein